MDRGFIPPESDEGPLPASDETFLGEFGERQQPPTEVDAEDPRIAFEPDTGEIRPL